MQTDEAELKQRAAEVMQKHPKPVGPYMNDPGFEVPENKILMVPFPGREYQLEIYKEIFQPLKGDMKRDWFNDHFYYCLPVNVGSQYGFVLKSYYDFEVTWDGSFDNPDDITVNVLNDDGSDVQWIKGGFSNGVLTVQNRFNLKTPPGINLMTIQTPNGFIPGMVSMTAVIETDNLRRDFSFNFKLTDPGRTIRVNKGDMLGAVIPIPRYFVDSFELDSVNNYFSDEVIANEHADGYEFNRQRVTEDLEKPHSSGRKYFKGEHAFGDKFPDHQKHVR